MPAKKASKAKASPKAPKDVKVSKKGATSIKGGVSGNFKYGDIVLKKGGN